MPGPYDYTSAFDNLPSPQDAIMDGIKNGVAITDVQNQRAQQARDLAAQQEKQKVIQDLVNNPNATADDYANAAIKVPELHTQFKQAWETKSAAQQQTDLRNITEWSAAIQSGQPKIASDAMRAQADAMENTAGGPTASSKALRAKADLVDSNPDVGNAIFKAMLAAHPNGKAAIDGIVALNQDQRAADKAPADKRKADSDAWGANYDAEGKRQGVVGQTFGSLVGKSARPDQAITAIKSMQSRGLLSADEAQAKIDSIPTDPKALDSWLGQQRDAGIKPDDQKKFVAPDANTVANNATSRANTADNNRTQLAVQDKIAAREKAKDDATDVADLSPSGIENAAARYNVDGSLPALGNGKTAATLKAKILNRAAEMKAGVDPTQQRQDQLATKSQQRVIQDFTSGKSAASVRSFNVGISHLDTLGQLADALHNKDTQVINRIGNYFATQTGSAAPTDFNAAKKIVGDEIVKAIVGAGGGVHDREEAARVIDAANTPAQLKGAINTYKELMIGQLGGLEQQYHEGSGKQDFERFLSQSARTLRRQHGAAGGAAGAAAPDLPSGWSVEVH